MTVTKYERVEVREVAKGERWEVYGYPDAFDKTSAEYLGTFADRQIANDFADERRIWPLRS
jgi:hypothetical protein